MIHGSMLLVLLTIMAIVALALCMGGAPERCGATVLIGMAGVQLTARAIIPNYWTVADIGPLLADTLGFFGLGAVALFAHRVWPLVAAALQLISLGAHFARWSSIEISPIAYAITRDVPTALFILILAWATVSHRQTLKGGPVAADWQTWPRCNACGGRCRPSEKKCFARNGFAPKRRMAAPPSALSK